MRIGELKLERYGRFENHSLVFPRSERDFHLVFGPNEAGKTTTLAALTDLLFGFEHAVGQDYRFAASLLRVGAVLEEGAQRLAVRRRRGRQGTLVDADDRPIDEGPIAAMLHGLRREAFLLSHSLDHERLRRGGQAMAESKDDLGQMLFAAGSGLTGLRSILAGLDAELDELWGPRRAEKRAYTRSERALADAKGALREVSVKPIEWTKARDECERLRSEHAASDGARRTAAEALASVERLRRVYAPLARRSTLLEQLRADIAVVVPEEVETLARRALQTAADEEQKRGTALSLLQGIQQRLDQEPDDELALTLTERIEALVQSVGAEVDRRDQLPRREQELHGRRSAAAEAAARLGLPIGDDLSSSLPGAIEVGRLRDLANRHVQLAALHASATDAVKRAEAEVARADAALSAACAPEGLELLRSAVDAVVRAGDLDSQIEGKRAALERAQRRLVEALATLAPWSGDAASLARLAPPLDPTIATAKAELDLAENDAAEARRALASRTEALSQAEARVASLSSGGAAVSIDALTKVREERDAALSVVRRHVSGAALSTDPSADMDRLEQGITAADGVADRRFMAADASARLAQAEAEIVEARLRLNQADAHATAATATVADLKARWCASLEGLGVPLLQPEELRDWLLRRNRALERAEACDEAESELRVASAAREAAAANLNAALAEAAPTTDLALAGVLARAEARLSVLQDAARTFAECTREAKDARVRCDNAQLACRGAERDIETWRETWNAALAEAGLVLAPEAAETRLAAFETLRAELEQARGLKRRVDTMGADSKAFAAEALAVCQSLGLEVGGHDALELVRLTKRRLDAAQISHARRKALEEEAERRRDEIDAAQAALNAAELALDDARALTGATDRIALAAALDASRSRREVEAEVADLERQIREHGDGRPLGELEAACALETSENLAERAADLARGADETATRAQTASERAAEAELRLLQLDSGQAAAGAAADFEQARAELEALSEVYLLKRAQRVLLDYAMRRQARERRNPLLARAADLFRTLTLDRYADLRVDYEAERPRLLGMFADGATTVGVSDMSEGTQDQLYLALRLAAVEQGMEAGARLPFLADDLFVTFDDDRARAGLEVLGELSRSTQVLFFTHHAHLKQLAREVFGESSLSTLELTEAT